MGNTTANEITEENQVNNDQSNYIKGVIESLLFVNERPITLDQIKKVLPSVTPSDIKTVIGSLEEDYTQRDSGITIKEIAGGYQMLSNSSYASYIREFYKTKHKEKLSKPSLETLAIIAYKQPVTRGDIELIRGVNSDGVVVHLVNKELIKIVGKKDIPGKPFLYGTTKLFLEYFGLKSLNDLPELKELADFEQKKSGEMDQEAAAESLEQLEQKADEADQENKESQELSEDSQEVAQQPVEETTEEEKTS